MSVDNFFVITTVSNTSFDGYINWDFNSSGILLALESGSNNDILEYSFDGENIHGRMRINSISDTLSFDNRRQNKIWFRKLSGPSLSIDVRVEAWR